MLQSVAVIAGGGGSSGITIGSTAITGGADTQVLFNDGGFVGSDAGFSYNKATDVATIVGGVNIGGATTAFPSLTWNTTQTVDTLLLALGTTSRHVVICENGDTGFDFAHAQATSPTLFVHSQNQSTTQWISLSHDATYGRITSPSTSGIVMDVGASGGAGYLIVRNHANIGHLQLGETNFFQIQGDSQSTGYCTFTANYSNAGYAFGSVGDTTRNRFGASGSGTNDAADDSWISGGAATGNALGGNVGIRTSVPGVSGTTTQTQGDRGQFLAKYTTLTAATATAFARVNIPSGTVAGGQIVVTVEANDGTEYQARTLRAIWSAANKAGTTTVTLSTPEEAVAVSSGTLTVTLTLVDSGSGNIDFKADAASSLTETVLRANAQVIKNFGTGAISAQ